MKCAIVLLNYNGLDLLKRFLPDVVNHSKDAQIYLADNGSSDQSMDWVSKNYAHVKIIALDRNYGYAEGHNRALQQIEEALVILLNNDVQVPPNWTEPIQLAFRNDPLLVAAQPKIMDLYRPTHFEYAGAAGGFLDQLGYPFCQGRIFDSLEEDLGQYDQNTALFWASGACLCLRRSAFLKAGGFDGDLFAHQEEIDLCWRLQSQGGHIRLIANVCVFHQGGGTLSKHSTQKTFLNFRNSLLVLTKMVGGPKIVLIVMARLLLDGLAGLRFLISGKPRHTWAIIKAHLDYYRKLPLYLTKRKKYKSAVTYARTHSIVFDYYMANRRSFKDL
ncbi:MAG: glycosyltransferase family 2 protein [Bacteroidetes bacterium]|nr:glycosyltransferase family 2 protein [Bacteroidota bacterium]